jgi:hypothetical protein
VPFDQIFGLAPGAIETVIEPLGIASGEICHDIPDIGAFFGHLDPRHDTTRPGPGFRAISSLGVEEDRRLGVAAYGEAIRDMQLRGGLPADMDWRLIQLATLSLATYPIAFTQITRLVTGKDAEDPAFQAEWADFLRVLGHKLLG